MPLAKLSHGISEVDDILVAVDIGHDGKGVEEWGK